MSRPRSSVLPARRSRPAEGPLRLDLLVNPYGPSMQVAEALASSDELHLPSAERELRLHLRLAAQLRVSPDWLLLANGIDELLGMISLWRRGHGPLVLFPPTNPEAAQRAERYGLEVVSVPRSPRFALDLSPERLAQLPRSGTALVMAPNDPTGSMPISDDVVALSRHSDLLVIDERHAAYSGRTLLPFAREFENVMIVSTFETWAGLAGVPVAYAIAPPPLIAALEAYRRPGGLAMGAVIAASATLDDLAYVQATMKRVREEKARLYRMLRKLNMVRPLPSWGNFLLVRIERGNAQLFARELARRGIQVYLPPQPELANHLRISATQPDQTHALKEVLIEIAASL